MKLFKRTLALLLVAATLLGLGLTAGAANIEYTDASSISHAAAVDILSGLGVIKGYANGSFKPASSVTRAEVSKMLAFILNGGEDVGDMYIDACTFDDAKNHWAAGYIGYCVSVGIINGKNATTFAPDGKLTGYELSKLLLCTLGYKADLNGLVGPQWNTTAHSMAIKNDLLANLKEYDPSKNICREDTCQMIFNTLLATKVETTGSITELGKVTIASNVENTQIINDAFDYRVGIAPDGYMQLIEDVLPDLRQMPGANDEFGRPATTWRMSSMELGTYVTNKPIISQEGGFAMKALRTALKNEIPENVVVYWDGARQAPKGCADPANYAANVNTLLAELGVASINSVRHMNGDQLSTALYNADTDGVAGIDKKSGQAYAADFILGQFYYSGNAAVGIPGGNNSFSNLASNATIAEVYYEADTSTLTFCVGHCYYGKVLEIRPEVTDENGDVVAPSYFVVDNTRSLGLHANLELNENTVVEATNASIPILTSLVNPTEDGALEVGSYVAYYSGKDAEGKYVPQGAYLMSVSQETITRTSTISGRTYSNTITGSSKTSYSHAYTGESKFYDIGKTYDVYYVLYGSASRYFFLKGVNDNCVYVYNAGKKQNTVVDAYQAKIVNNDGSVEIVETDVNYGPMGRNLVGSIAIPSKNALGQTVLTGTGDYSGNNNVVASVTNKVSGVNFDGTVKYADETTRFIVGTFDNMGNEQFTCYKGISAVPTITGVKYYAYTENPETGKLDTVFFVNASGIIGSTEQEGVIVKTGKESVYTNISGTYYELQAMVGKEASTFKVTAALYNSLSNGMNLFAGYTKDATGLVSAVNKISGTKITDFAPADAGNIRLNGNTITYHANVLVYTYSVRTNKLELSTVESLYAPNATFDSFYTRHEHLTNKPLAAIFMIVD